MLLTELGAERMVIRNLQETFVTELVWRAVQCNAIYVCVALTVVPDSTSQARKV